MAVTTYIVDKDGNQADASQVTVPSGRDFRGAWTLSGNEAAFALPLQFPGSRISSMSPDEKIYSYPYDHPFDTR